MIGRDPREVPSEILSLYHREQNPLKALRERCLDCCCGSATEVRKCVATACVLWPFRLGTNPFRKRGALSEEERRKRVARLRRASEKSLR